MSGYFTHEIKKWQFQTIVKAFLESSEAELDLTDTGINPLKLKEILELLGWREDEWDSNGWEYDVWANYFGPKDVEFFLRVDSSWATFELRIVKIFDE